MLGVTAIVIGAFLGLYGAQQAIDNYHARDFYYSQDFDDSDREACKKIYNGYSGCIAALEEVIVAARNEMRHCEETGDWSQCEPKDD